MINEKDQLIEKNLFQLPFHLLLQQPVSPLKQRTAPTSASCLQAPQKMYQKTKRYLLRSIPQ
jgi:hypothetical protein